MRSRKVWVAILHRRERNGSVSTLYGTEKVGTFGTDPSLAVTFPTAEAAMAWARRTALPVGAGVLTVKALDAYVED